MDLLEIRKKARLKAEEEARKAASGPGQTGEASAVEPVIEPSDEPVDVAVEAAPSPKPKKKRAAPKKKKIAAPEPEDAGWSEAEVFEAASETEIGADSEIGDMSLSLGEDEALDDVRPGPEPVAVAETPAEEDESGEDIVEYLAFRLGSEEYAVKVEDVREIIRLQKITAVPRAQGFVRGIISLRGVIIPIFDIKKRLGFEETDSTRTTRIVVVAEEGMPQGMIVDKVTGVVRFQAKTIEPPPAVIGGVEAEYIHGVGRIGDRLLILFNTGRVLAMEG